MKITNKTLLALAVLVLSGVLSISGTAFAELHDSRIFVPMRRPQLYHRHYRAEALPEPPEFREFDKNRKPPKFPEGKRPPMSHDKRFDDGKRMPPPPKGDRKPPEFKEPKGFRPNMPPHHRHMAKR